MQTRQRVMRGSSSSSSASAVAAGGSASSSSGGVAAARPVRCRRQPRQQRLRSSATAAPPAGGLSYKAAGVDIDAGDELVRRIQKLNPSIGGFSGLVPFGDSFLVAGTDGVGTKLKLAFDMDKHDSVGIDLVAMSVNDIVTSGAQPLFFLDYFATGLLNVDQAEQVWRSLVLVAVLVLVLRGWFTTGGGGKRIKRSARTPRHALSTPSPRSPGTHTHPPHTHTRTHTLTPGHQGHRGRLPAVGLPATGRRDGRDARLLRQGRVRPGWLCCRRGRAGEGHNRCARVV
jgi:hypothetical protein